MSGRPAVAQEAEVNAQNLLDAARDAAAKAEWDFHNARLGVKEQALRSTEMIPVRCNRWV